MRRSIHARRLWWIAPIAALITLVCWALASPVGASPDEDFHLTSVWCGLGDRAGLCEPGRTADQRSVPVDLLKATCFAGHPATSASCQGADFGIGRERFVSTTRGNFHDQLYPPLFYAAMSVFASPDVDASVLAMRCVNAVLFVGLLTLLWLLLPIRRRWTAIATFAVTAIPLGIFVIASINPSSWAIISAGTFWIALLGYYEVEGRRRWGLGAIAIASAVIGAGARADSALFNLLAIVVVVILTSRRSKRFFLLTITPAIIAIISYLLYRTGSQSSAGATGLSGAGIPHGGALRLLIELDTFDVPDLWVGVFGHWSLGWFDTPMPAAVWVGTFAVFAIAMFVGLANVSRRKLIALGIVSFVAWAFPLALLVQSNTTVGAYVQPRYVLPVLVLTAGVALYDSGRGWPRPNRTQVAVVVAALSLAASLALFANIRRYVTGTDVVSLNLDSHVEWWWIGAPPPEIVWLVGTLAGIVALGVVAAPIWFRRGAPSGSPQRTPAPR